MFSDINTTHWIFNKTPQALHPYIKLARLDRPAGTWLLLLPCWWSIVLSQGGILTMSLTAWLMIVLTAIGALLMRSAGCVINDMWDRKMDAQVERTRNRPLASGEIGMFGALIFLWILLAASFGILLLMPRMAILLGIISLVPVIIYPFMKRITWWPQLFLGLTFNWGALLGWAAATGTFGWTSLILYAGGIFWTLGYDTIYAHQDKRDDAAIGVKSTALLFEGNSRIFVILFFALSLSLTLLTKYMTSPTSLTPWLALLPFLHLLWQVTAWRMDDPESCARIFRSNVIYGGLILLLFAL